MADLDGRVAFITGAGSGIGRAIAERLARDGADIFGVDLDKAGARDTADRVTEQGRRAEAFQANVASQTQTRQAVDACVERFGRLDIAVANAGIVRPGSLLDTDLKTWQVQIDVNLTGTFLTVQAAARQMIAQGHGGRIICMSSLAAEVASPWMFAYAATKAGIRMMVHAWAAELGPRGITVNAIGPGYIETPAARGITGDPGSRARQWLESNTPVGRVGQPDDVAGLARFMAGPEGAFMNGSYVIMDGGQRETLPGREPDADTAQEMQDYIQESEARYERLQPLIDSR